VHRSLWPKYLGVPLLVALLGFVGYIVQKVLPPSEGVRFGAFRNGSPLEIGKALFTSYLLPFEVTSVLILVAILGAIVLARGEVD
jgi:NADH-quinone oxidoreductase subunit J